MIHSSNATRLHGRKIALTAPNDGNVLTFDSTNGWQPEAPSGGGDMKIFVPAGTGKVTGATLNTHSRFPAYYLRDAQLDEWYLTVKVPAGATSISAIKLLYARGHTGNLFMQFLLSHFDYTSGDSVVTDGDAAEAAYAGGANDNTLGLITVPSAAYNGFTIGEDDIIGLNIFRNASDATDTYTADLRVLGVMFEFA